MQMKLSFKRNYSLKKKCCWALIVRQKYKFNTYSLIMMARAHCHLVSVIKGSCRESEDRTDK